MEVRPVAIVGYDGAELLDIACVTSTLGLANTIGALQVPYRVIVVSPGGHPITCGPGVVLHSGQALERLTEPLDTVIVSGGTGHISAAANPSVVAHVRRLATLSRRVASVCTGATVLAAAGLLNGRRATTHWRFADALAAQFAQVTVDPDPIYIRDGPISTAAGVTSALDLTLAFVEEDHGIDLARMLARDLVTYLQRPGNQAQMSLFTAAPPAEHANVRDVLNHINTALGSDLGTTNLARIAGVSPRHLTRLFLTELGRTPGRYVRDVRTAAAAHLLSTTALPLPDIAARCGLGSAETLRTAFQRRYGIAPSRYRSIHDGSGAYVSPTTPPAAHTAPQRPVRTDLAVDPNPRPGRPQP